jgi:hypothetical protein
MGLTLGWGGDTDSACLAARGDGVVDGIVDLRCGVLNSLMGVVIIDV